jgi:hypothetical protein
MYARVYAVRVLARHFRAERPRHGRGRSPCKEPESCIEERDSGEAAEWAGQDSNLRPWD